MFWTALILFVGSFALTQILAPKPEIENARPDNLSNLRSPRADEGSPIPFLYGRMLVRSPNTLWRGAVTNWPLKQKVQTGTFSSEDQITGYAYFMSFDLAICLGPDVLMYAVVAGTHEGHSYAGVGTGNLSYCAIMPYDAAVVNIMYGQEIYRSVLFYNGDFDQAIDPLLEQELGADVPAYRGVAHVVFYLPALGRSATLPTIAFEVGRYPSNLGLSEPVRLIGDDLNPIEILYSLLTETWGGLGLPSSNFDIPSFTYAAEVVAGEENGMSILIDQPNEIKSVVQEILRQIDGVLYQEPTDGKIVLKLIRDDYTVSELPLFTVSDISEVSDFTCSSWDETYNQVRVTYCSRIGRKYEDATAFAQDFANIGTLGKVRSTTLSFPGVHTRENAARLAARELSYLSVPLYRATLTGHRSLGQLRPGSAFRLTWPELGLTEAVFRVQRFNLNELVNGRVSMEIVQDKFAAKDALFGSSDTTDAGSDRPAVSVSEYAVLESPYWHVTQVADLVEPTTGYSWLWFFAKPGGLAQLYYSVHSSPDNFVDDPVGSLDLSQVPYPPHATLVGDIYKMMGMANGILGQLIIQNIWPDIGEGTNQYFTNNTTDRIRTYGRGMFLMENELCSYLTRTDNGDGTITLTSVYRALLDTAPEDHPDGTLIWFFAADSPQVVSGLTWLATKMLHDDTDLIYFRFVSSTDNSAENVADTTIRTVTPRRRYVLPLPPDMTEIATLRICTELIITNTTLSISGWYTRNRVSPTTVALYNDSEDTPESGTTYEFDFYIDDILVAASTGVSGSSTTLTVRGKDLARLENWAKEEDRIVQQLKDQYSIYREYREEPGMQEKIVAFRMLSRLRNELPDLLPDGKNFDRSLARWRRNAKTGKQSVAEQAEAWLRQPNAHDSWEDYIKKYVHDLLVHGSVANYKTMSGSLLQFVDILPGGSVYPLRERHVLQIRLIILRMFFISKPRTRESFFCVLMTPSGLFTKGLRN